MAEPLFVDTNAWLRFVTRDDNEEAFAVAQLLRQAEAGEHSLTTNHLVMAEIEWTLRSFYRETKAEVIGTLADMVSLKSLRLERRHVVVQALELYARHNVDFVDAYTAADMRASGIETNVSYDRDFDRLGVSQLAP